jgi:putative cardiolipin synthase
MPSFSIFRSTGRRPRTKHHCGARSAFVALCIAITLAGCATQRRDVPRLPSGAWPHHAETTLGRSFAEQISRYPGQSGFYPLVSGMEAFSIRAGLAENAERTLDLQYFIVREDTTTQLLLYRVLRAADRGVRVRLLVDDLDALGKDLDLATFSAHPNIEVRAFNTFLNRGALGLSQILEFLGDSERLNRRMHNKLWIADNAAAVIGGRNLGDEYFDAHGDVNFSDLDVLAAGPVVRDISRSFDDYWNSEWAVPVEAFVTDLPGPQQLAEFSNALATRLEGFRDTEYARVLRETRLGSQLSSGQLPLTIAEAGILYDKPPKIANTGVSESPGQIQLKIRTVVEAARQEVILISPYFIPSEQGIGIMSALVRRGVRVRILTNSLASADYIPLAHAGYARLRARLLAAGLELHEMRPEPLDAGRSRRPGASSAGYLHTKAIVVDRRHVLMGSMNLDPRSRALNTEIALVMESPEFGGRLAALFEEAVRPAHAFHVVLSEPGQEHSALIWITEEDGKELRYDYDPLTGIWRRLLSRLLEFLAPDSLL